MTDGTKGLMYDGIKRFYKIERGEGDTCMVSFFNAKMLTTIKGETDWDVLEYSMPVQWYDGLEENIRHNYIAWLAHAKAYCMARSAFETALAAINAPE